VSVELSRVEEFALITLNRPQALNALSFALVRDLERAFDEVAASDARALQTTVAEGMKIEADLSTLAFQTEDAAEGMAAFLAKRKPAFKDR
jgi:enoyl-CoA hydratase/carnithine racemase